MNISNRSRDVIHWCIFILFAVGMTVYIVGKAKEAEGQFKVIVDNQKTMMRLLENNTTGTSTTGTSSKDIMTRNTNQTKQDNSAGVQSSALPRVVIQTTYGDITLELFKNRAPHTVDNFLKLARKNFYDDVKFHRVIKGFMIQAGDPLTKDDANKARWGTGGPGYTFADEIYNGNANVKGTIAMAHTSQPNSNGSQFFINVVDNHALDSGYTVFGRVVDGMDVVTKIENTPTGARDIPLAPVSIKDVVTDGV